MKKHHKLVRDKIPDIIRAQGQKPIIRILDDKEYVEQLIEKLCEAVDEFDEDRTAAELADILEVITALMKALGIKQEDLRTMRSKKAATRGTFKKRIFLEKVVG
ncbi:MAG TPA: nucleoside triphosphate pyrophosphohydrolase [Patescibacteria group bacterium]|nr:nucleoside triphosphate pyrophosphohydrolase [Patescibacteria group bacterium]